MPDDIAHFACAYMCANFSKEHILGVSVLQQFLIDGWNGAIQRGIISGDVNGDGVRGDDPRELLIQDYQKLFDYLGLPLRAVDQASLGLPMVKDRFGELRIAPTRAPLDPAKYWVHECWVWKIGHFIVSDGPGQSDPWYDPIMGGSLTRKNGHIETIRVFEIVQPHGEGDVQHIGG